MIRWIDAITTDYLLPPPPDVEAGAPIRKMGICFQQFQSKYDENTKQKLRTTRFNFLITCCFGCFSTKDNVDQNKECKNYEK